MRGELQSGDSNLLLSSSPATISKDIVKEIAQSEWIGGNYKIRFEGNIESFARRTKEIIGGGLSVGWSLEKIQKSIRDEFQTSRYETARLVRTESAYFLGQADLASYVEDGVVDYRYLATLDRRTSKVCRSLDGKVFKVKDAVVGKNYPPMHPNCRSGTIPVLETMVDPETGKPLGIPIEPKFVRSARDYITGERYETTAKNYKEYYEEQRKINKSAMREHYTDMRPIEDINKYIRVVEPPKLTQKQRQRILDTPVYKRIGLSQEQYMDDNIIKPHEREFAEKFTDLGYKIKWISRIRERKLGTGYLPTNDLIWNNEEWELKRAKKKKYASISKLIKEGRKSEKMNFIIDLDRSTLKENLAKNLAMYNKNNPQNTIQKLYLLDNLRLVEILLEK